MRKVKFKVFIPTEYEKNSRKKIDGTGIWSGFDNEGIFHCWGADFEEFEAGPGNYSVALVEIPNGEIKRVLPSDLKFID